MLTVFVFILFYALFVLLHMYSLYWVGLDKILLQHSLVAKRIVNENYVICMNNAGFCFHELFGSGDTKNSSDDTVIVCVGTVSVEKHSCMIRVQVSHKVQHQCAKTLITSRKPYN